MIVLFFLCNYFCTVNIGHVCVFFVFVVPLFTVINHTDKLILVDFYDYLIFVLSYILFMSCRETPPR